ncbi:MAG: hypothetical protein R3E31_12270 [Chloroflexota bacterium]|nr:hypothetical protein [Anaerolineales bacterium]MCB8967232.1 hypothetical protein [Ardenticatenaceae bacterium]
MSQNKRNLLALLILLLIIAAVLLVENMRRSSQAEQAQSLMPPGMPTAAPGSIPIYDNGVLLASFQPTDLEQLTQTSFTDAEEGKAQEGWMLRDVLRLYLSAADLPPEATITVISNHRGKSAQLTWAEVDDPANMVMFDLAGRGTLKLVSLLPQLDTREEWVQDVDRIEVVRSP